MNPSQDDSGGEVEDVDAFTVALLVRTCRRHRQLSPAVDVAVAVCLVMPVERAVSGFAIG